MTVKNVLKGSGLTVCVYVEFGESGTLCTRERRSGRTNRESIYMVRAHICKINIGSEHIISVGRFLNSAEKMALTACKDFRLK